MKKAYYELTVDLLQKLKIETNYLNYETPTHFHRNYELQYIMEGEYYTKIENEMYTIKKNEILFIPSFFSHSAIISSRVKSTLLIIPYTFSFDFSKELENKTLNCHLDDTEFNRTLILPFLKLLKNNSFQLNNNLIVKGYMDIIFGNLINKYGLNKINHKQYDNFIIDVIQYVDKHYDEPINLTSLSKTFGYNKFYFSRLFNESTGISCIDYINQIRLQKFINIFGLNKHQNITKTIFSCGFNSITTFYRSFRQIYNSSPSEYFKLY